MISVYSFCSSVVFYNICLLIVFILRRRTRFLTRYTTSVLILLTALGLIRLFTPLDLAAARIIRSYTVLPFVVRILNTSAAGVSLGGLLLAVWGAGTVGFALRDAICALRFAKKRRSFSLVRSEQAERVAAGFGSYRIAVSPQVAAPYLAGLFAPVIYLPCMQLSDGEMKLILRHEIQHIHSHDALAKLLFLSIEAIFWWNPLAHISLAEIDAILEVQCDAKLTALMDGEELREYMQSLLAVMRQLEPGHEREAPCRTALLGGRENTRQRFELMLSRGAQATKKKRGVLCAVFAALFLLSYLVIVQPYSTPPAADLAGVIEITPENAYIVFEGGKYFLYADGQFIGTPSESELEIPPLNGLETKNHEQR